jgi:hypothetical protein
LGPLTGNGKLNTGAPPMDVNQSLKRFRTDSDIANWMRSNFGDRPEWNQLLQSINTQLTGMNGGENGTLMSRAEIEFKNLGAWLKQQDRLRIPKLNLPGFNVKAPRLHVTIGNGPAVPIASAAGNGSLFGLAAVVFGGLIYAGWYLRKQDAKKKRSAAAALEATTSETYVAVRDRHEFVKAYEALWLRTHGPQSAAWHHHKAAQAWQQVYPDQTQAVLQLSACYERMRYQGQDQHLSDADWSALQTQLRSLAHAQMPGRAES